jgi:GxxExxY protein
MDENEVSGIVIGSAVEVHKHLGPGLLEAIYRDCLVYELSARGIRAVKEVGLPVRYKGLEFPGGYRADLIVEDLIIVELKAVDAPSPIFTAQLLSYLKMSELKLGLLINFNVVRLTEGVKRVVNKL